MEASTRTLRIIPPAERMQPTTELIFSVTNQGGRQLAAVRGRVRRRFQTHWR